jgi:hypothetical protein
MLAKANEEAPVLHTLGKMAEAGTGPAEQAGVVCGVCQLPWQRMS